MSNEIKKICVWSQDSECSDIWLSSCKNAFTLIEGTPKENKVQFCMFCGRPVQEVVFNYEGAKNG